MHGVSTARGRIANARGARSDSETGGQMIYAIGAIFRIISDLVKYPVQGSLTPNLSASSVYVSSCAKS